MIAVVDYGSGNIEAICTIYRKLNVPVVVARTPEQLAAADRILLPGVGAFDQAIGELDRSGLRQPLEVEVLQRRKPVLGICVGMQLLAHRSDEGVRTGLGWIDGEVRRFDEAAFRQATHLPHMGWNTLAVRRPSPLLAGVEASEFYFLHSYHFCCRQPDDELAVTCYGGDFTAAVHRGNIFGVQFHPEKSHQSGVALLRNFAQAAL